MKTEEDFLWPVCSCGPIFPPSLIDLIKNVVEEDDNGIDCNESLLGDDDD